MPGLIPPDLRNYQVQGLNPADRALNDLFTAATEIRARQPRPPTPPIPIGLEPRRARQP